MGRQSIPFRTHRVDGFSYRTGDGRGTQLLGKVSDGLDAEPAVRRLLDDPNPEVRRAAKNRILESFDRIREQVERVRIRQQLWMVEVRALPLLC